MNSKRRRSISESNIIFSSNFFTLKYILIICLVLFSGIASAQVFQNTLAVPVQGQLANIASVRPRPGGLVNLRPEIDLTAFLPTPGMQGYTQGSCAAWSIAYGLVSYLKQRQERWLLLNPNQAVYASRVYSPAFLYNELTTDPKCGQGIYLNEALQYSIDIGSLSLQKFPYDPARCDRKGTADEKKDAGEIQLLSFNKVFDAFENPLGRQIDVLTVKSLLNDSNAVVIGAHLDKSFMDDTYGNRNPGASRPYIWDRFQNNTSIYTAYHAMICIGYNDRLSAFKVMNSWNTNFGDGGYIWISEDVFQQVVKEAYVGVLKPRDAKIRPLIAREPPNPTETQNISKELIKDVNWIKEGYYRQYADLRVGCLDLDRKRQSAIIRLTNTADERIISTIYLKVGEDYQVYFYKGREISIRIVKIAKAGKNPLKKAVFYDLLYRNLTGVLF